MVNQGSDMGAKIAFSQMGRTRAEKIVQFPGAVQGNNRSKRLFPANGDVAGITGPEKNRVFNAVFLA